MHSGNRVVFWSRRRKKPVGIEKIFRKVSKKKNDQKFLERPGGCQQEKKG